MKKWLVVTCLSVFLVQCVSFQSEEKKPPVITSSMDREEAIDAAVTFGDETLEQVRRLLQKRKEQGKAGDELYHLIGKNFLLWPGFKLLNAVRLYQTLNHSEAHKLFAILVRSERSLGQQMGWRLATALPGPLMAKEIDRRLTEDLKEDTLSDDLFPEMAQAVASNGLTHAYTIVRKGLFTVHHPAFAEAMALLDSQRASEDFLEYLSLANPEELRQLSLVHVDLLTCSRILDHLASHPTFIANGKIEILFYYSVSRTTALSEGAKKVLARLMETDVSYLAFVFINLPTWAQMAYIEGTHQNYNATAGHFLGEVEKRSAQKEIIEEIQSVIR